MYVCSRVVLARGFLPEVITGAKASKFLLHAMGSRSDPVLRKDGLQQWKYDIQQAVRCHGDYGQQGCRDPCRDARISTVCRAYVRCARQTPSAKATRRGRSIRKVVCTQKTGDDVGHTDSFFISRTLDLTALFRQAALICVASIDAR